MHCCAQCPQPCSRPPLTHASAVDSWTLTGKSGSVSFGVTAPFSWVLVHKVLFVLSKSLFSQSCVSSGGSMVGGGEHMYTCGGFILIFGKTLLAFDLLQGQRLWVQ